jgi:hypothetical protein
VHFTGAERAGHFQQAVRQRGFAVVDVRDDAKIPYELCVHVSFLPQAFSFPIARRFQTSRAVRLATRGENPAV